MATFVLVPGAWMGDWVSKPVKDALERSGHEVYSLTLSGVERDAETHDIGLETHVSDVVELIRSKKLERVVLVGHSYSGIVVGAVADRLPDLITDTVYVQASVPQDRKSMLDGFGPEQRDEELREIAQNDGRWAAPRLGSGNEQSLTNEQADWLDARLVDHPGRTVAEPVMLNLPAESRRSTYIECQLEGLSERVAALIGQLGWTFLEIDSGHWPMVSDPEKLANLLDSVAMRHGN